MDVSVLLATFDRSDMLDGTLQSFTQLDAPGIAFEIIVADNAADDRVRSLVEGYRERLPIMYVPEPERGKNRAITAALKYACGSLLVFTDDDVIAAPDWLVQMWTGAARHPKASLFGGRILPSFPEGHEAWLRQLDFHHWFIRSAYVMADWDCGETEVSADRIWGPNMAVRRSVFDAGLCFDLHIGPGESNYIMGSETEFLLRAQAAGYVGVYLPQALVHHRIREEQLSEKWLLERAFRMGRGHAKRGVKTEVSRIAGIPRHLFSTYGVRTLEVWSAAMGLRSGCLRERLELEMLRGEISQHWRMRQAHGGCTA